MTSFLTTLGSARLRQGGLPAPLDALATRLAVGRYRPAIDTVLGDLAGSAGGAYREAAGWAIHRARRRTGGGLVVFVGPPHRSILSVRIAGTDLGRLAFQREEAALAALLAADLPDGVRRLVPEVVATGEVSGVGYLVQRFLAGRGVDPRRRGRHGRARLLAAVAAAIRPLHEATAAEEAPSAEDIERWVDRRVGLVLQLTGSEARRDRSVDARLAALCSTLRESLLGSPIRTARIHGDLWTGNVLIERDPGGAPAVSGIVDWDSSTGNEPPFQDLLHLQMYTQKLVERAPLGTVIVRALAGKGPQPSLAGQVEPPTLTRREELLLYWLRQVEVNLVRNPAGSADPRWRRRNVDPVIACL
jgi:aminoglycoside phosphotransferase (APT) family kinase protein